MQTFKVKVFFGSKEEEFIQIPFPYLVPNLKGRKLHILFYGLSKKYVFVCLFSLMFIVVGVFRFVCYSYSSSMRAAIGVYLVNSSCRLRFTRSNNISFPHLIWMALSPGIWGKKT